MVQEQKIRRPSAAKAAVAQSKPRDASGKFLSGAELAAYQAQAQQAQFAAEQARVSNILGRTPQTMPQAPVSQASIQAPAGFAAILAANKPGSMASELDEQSRWDALLGRKRRQL